MHLIWSVLGSYLQNANTFIIVQFDNNKAKKNTLSLRKLGFWVMDPSSS